MNLIASAMKECIKDPNFWDHKTWDSLRINRRKPHTDRIFKLLPSGLRICVHRFEPCSEEESFAHPHAWPAEFFVLTGSYKEDIYVNITDNIPLVTSYYGSGSFHSIYNPLTWHRITPLETTYTIMVNGPPFENPDPEVRTTKGKDLDKLTDLEKLNMLDVLINHYIYMSKAEEKVQPWQNLMMPNLI